MRRNNDHVINNYIHVVLKIIIVLKFFSEASKKFNVFN